MHGFLVKIHSKYCFSHQVAPPGKVKITSSGASDLKISHRLVHRLNRGNKPPIALKLILWVSRPLNNVH